MRILIIRTDFLGDSVMSSTFIYALAQLGVTLDILSAPYNHIVFLHNPHLSNKYYLYNTPENHEQILHNQEILREIGNNQYSATFILNRSLKNYHLLKYVKTNLVFGHRLGVKSIRSRMFCLLSSMFSRKYHYVKYDDNIHEVNNQFNLLNFALNILLCHSRGHSSQSGNPYYAPPINCYFYTANTNSEVANSRIPGSVAVNISGRSETVRYLPSSLARCIVTDLLNLGKKILIIATSSDKSRAEAILSELQQMLSAEHLACVQLCAEESLLDLVDVLAQYEYYIGADGGLLHVAAGLHLNCIGLFHAQNIGAWHPWTDRQVCVQTASKKIYDITSHDVMTALLKLSAHN